MGSGRGWESLRYRRSLASRVTLLTTMAVGIAVTGVAFAAYATVRMQSIESIDRSLHARAEAAAKPERLESLARQEVPAWALGAGDVKLVVVDARASRAIAWTDMAAAREAGRMEFDVALGKDSWSARTVVIDGVRYRAVAVPVKDGPGQDSEGQALILSQSLKSTDQMLDRLGLVMLLFGLAGIISAALAGWGVARNGLRPVRRLTTAVEEIARTERLDPIPVEGRDEVARLAMAFNSMLTALSASQARQRQLVADAGHELRTPLTSLRTNLDLLAQADTSAKLSAESRKELLTDVRGQIAEMTTLIGDLVELAREDPSARPAVEPVELAALVRQAVTRVRRRTTTTVQFEVNTEPWWVTGDSAALERAITNLLDNAVKWSPEGGQVTVDLKQGTIVVTDQGRGISEKDLPHVFDRFYRSTESRGMVGSGLGLSIVKAVADRHGGEVHAGAGPDGGATFRFHVPGTMAPPEVLART